MVRGTLRKKSFSGFLYKFKINSRRFSNKQLAMVRLSPQSRDVIVGLLLSDGWLILRSGPAPLRGAGGPSGPPAGPQRSTMVERQGARHPRVASVDAGSFRI